MSENIAATLRNCVYNGADEVTMHKAMLEAAGALEDMEAYYENRLSACGVHTHEVWSHLIHAHNDMKMIANLHQLCDCCKHLREDGSCGKRESNADNCWEWRGFGEVLGREG